MNSPLVPAGLLNDREACAAFALGLSRKTYRGRDGTPYLTRYLLAGNLEDGAAPAVYLHHFHRGDEDRHLHCHPWRHATSYVLCGGYHEERRMRTEADPRAPVECLSATVAIDRLPGSVVTLSRDTFHRVELLEHDAWTLLVVGPAAEPGKPWGYWVPEAPGGYVDSVAYAATWSHEP